MKPVVLTSDRERTLTPRGAAVRDRLLELAANMISLNGYAGTTIRKLAQEAKVGLGSILHQFPTRHDMMAEVTRYIADRLLQESDEELAIMSDPMDRLMSYPDVIWATANTTLRQAFSEITLAARWEPGLYEHIYPEVDRINTVFVEHVQKIAEKAGFKAMDELVARIQLLLAASHGLMLDKNLHGRVAVIQASLDCMKEDYRIFLRANS